VISESRNTIFRLVKGLLILGDRVLFSLGTVNLFSSFFGAYPTFAHNARSKIQSISGAKTSLTGIITSILIFIIMFTFLSVFQYLPLTTLAAIVAEAALRLIHVNQIMFTLSKRNFQEISKCLLSYLFTIFLPPDQGIIFCLVLSALVIIRRSTAINVSILGEIEVGDEIQYVDISDHPEAFVIAQIVPLVIRGSLEYYNAARISRRVEILIDAVSKLAHTDNENDIVVVQMAIRNSSLFITRRADKSVNVILDFQHVDKIDSSAAYELKRLIEKSSMDRIIFCGLTIEHRQILDFCQEGDVYDDFETALESVKLELYGESVHSADNQRSVRSLRQLRLMEGSLSEGLQLDSHHQYSIRSMRSIRDERNEMSVRSLRSTGQVASKPNLRTLFTGSTSPAPPSESVNGDHNSNSVRSSQVASKPNLRTLFTAPGSARPESPTEDIILMVPTSSAS
jgi:MFS superfamily sulfate permease-like transporter